jgi:hypothetical protein
MTANRQTVAWAKQYKELLTTFTEALGGENISPTKRAIVKTIATLQTELAVLSDRFAANGKGASADDLNMFLKISTTVGGLLESVGLGQPLQTSPAEGGHTKLEAILTNLVHGRQAEEAQGIFRDAEGNVITDPERVALEQQIYNLRRGIDAPAPIVNTVPEQLSAPQPAVPIAEPRAAKPATLTVVKSEPPKPAQLTPEQARERAMGPSIPRPPRDPKTPPSSSELYFGWVNSGGDGGSPGPHWPRP